jgi:hypothetical protein
MAGKNRTTVTPVNPVLTNGQILEEMKQANQATPIVPVQSQADLLAELEALKRENASLKSKIRLAVSEKGALSVYGLMRFPVTLYREQWEQLLAMTADIRAFIVANDSKLKRRGE